MACLVSPILSFGAELRILVSDDLGMPFYGLNEDLGEAQISVASLDAKLNVNETSDFGGARGAAFDIPPGAYSIFVFVPGFNQFEGMIRLTQQPRVVRIVMHLGSMGDRPTPSLKGRVVGLHGRAAWVQLNPIYGPTQTSRGKLLNVEVSEQGEFAFSNLQVGRHALLVFGEGKSEGSDPVVLAAKLIYVRPDEFVEVDLTDAPH